MPKPKPNQTAASLDDEKRPLHVGNTWGDLRDETPEIVRAEAKAWAKKVCELIYKRRATLKEKQSPQTWARTPGTPLPPHSLTQSSLLQHL